MALDTKQERGSTLLVTAPWRPWLSEPSGTIDIHSRLSLLKFSSDDTVTAITTNPQTVTTAGDWTLDLTGVVTVTFTNCKSAEGNKVGSDNGGGAASFAFRITNTGGATQLNIHNPAGGSEEDWTATLIGGTLSGQALGIFSGSNGVNGGGGGSLNGDAGSWLTSITTGTDNSVTGAGAAGQFTVSWTVSGGAAILNTDHLDLGLGLNL